jgi:DNA polymerase-3 subunit gamma/tau
LSYLVLARKYRPKTFEDIVGQGVVTRTLRGAIQEERIGHAYLFTGPRGTGKTTSARVFAKALNCEKGPTPEPCGECERCRAVDAGNETDLIEIDGASNTGVDSVRELRTQTVYAPMRARFKVYLIDEVHMLSKQAFNALLKTLEEPPPHVKFLFATTEPQKIPDTILSRCQILRLVPLAEEEIRDRLREVFEAESVDAGEGVAEELARRARGGLRDALSLADQLLALVGPAPTVEDVERLSSDGPQTLQAVLDALADGERAAVLQALPTIEGGEAELVSVLLDQLRSCMIAALCGPESAVLSRPAAEREALAALGKRIGARRIEVWLTELLHLRERLRILPGHARLLLEVTLLDLCDAEQSLDLAALAARLQALEARLAQGAVGAPQVARESPRSPAPADPRRAAAPAPPPAAQRERRPAAVGNARGVTKTDSWQSFLTELREQASSLADVIERRGKLRELASGRAVVQLIELREDERLLIEDKRNRSLCSKAFTKALGSPVDVDLQDAGKARPAAQDSFTSEVTDLFQGRVED